MVFQAKTKAEIFSVELSPCSLFNVTADPCEFDNLAFKLPSVVRMLKDTLEDFRSTAVPRGNKPVDPR